VPVKPSLIVHGGAGSIAADAIDATHAGIRRALQGGWKILSAGGSALDAVEAAIVVLEDDPFFNAGTGANLNRDGHVQLDAILMDGTTLKAGALAAVERIHNPIRLAHLIQEKSPHMLLAAVGAETFAVENGIPLCDLQELITDRSRAAWRKYRDLRQSAAEETHKGTVGAVALDSAGRIAAGTSTGGTPYKFPGRVGDSPLIGCGCYADDQAGGVSCTGNGEGIMKIVMAKAAIDLLRHSPMIGANANAGNAQAIAAEVIRQLADRAHTTGGLILLDHDGHPGFAFNTPAMSYGYVQPDGSFHISS
jgi:beta-aspartyl-peptidase (threonine type)